MATIADQARKATAMSRDVSEAQFLRHALQTYLVSGPWPESYRHCATSPLKPYFRIGGLFIDGGVESPISALRCIPKSLRRT
jgi:hypothetical protein